MGRASVGCANQDFQDYGGFTGLGRCVASFSPSDPSVRHWDRLWSSPVKGEGDSVGWFGLLLPRPVGTALKPV